MSDELPLMLIVTLLALAFVSWLLRIQLGSLGVPDRRILLLLIELWLSFSLIIALFVYAGAIIGPITRQLRVSDEYQRWWGQIHALNGHQQGLLLVLLALALVILLHFIWTLGNTRRQYSGDDTSEDGISETPE